MPGTCSRTAFRSSSVRIVAGVVAAVNAAAGILGDHHVGADVLDLLQQILLAGKADGDHQDERRRPMTMPSEVRMKRTLLTRKVSMATAQRLPKDQLGIAASGLALCRPCLSLRLLLRQQGFNQAHWRRLKPTQAVNRLDLA